MKKLNTSKKLRCLLIGQRGGKDLEQKTVITFNPIHFIFLMSLFFVCFNSLIAIQSTYVSRLLEIPVTRSVFPFPTIRNSQLRHALKRHSNATWQQGYRHSTWHASRPSPHCCLMLDKPAYLLYIFKNTYAKTFIFVK